MSHCLEMDDDVSAGITNYSALSEISSKSLLDGIPQKLEISVNHDINNADFTVSKTNEHKKKKVNRKNIQDKAPEAVGEDKHDKDSGRNRFLVDTTPPFESVREAVTKFGGIVDWKANKMQTIKGHKHTKNESKVEQENSTSKKYSEESEETFREFWKEFGAKNEGKLNPERSQISIHHESQDLEHAIKELGLMKTELEKLQKECLSLVTEGDVAAIESEVAMDESMEMESRIEELTLELLFTKECLQRAHESHLQAEEQRISSAMAKEQELLNCERELKQAEDELQKLNDQLLSSKDIKSKLDEATSFLSDLNLELVTFMEAKLREEGGDADEEDGAEIGFQATAERRKDLEEAVVLARKELEEINFNMEKTKEEINCLRVASISLKSEVQNEKSALSVMNHEKETTSMEIASLVEELNQTRAEAELVRKREKELRLKMAGIPKELEQAAQATDEAKIAVELAREDLKIAKEEAERVKACMIALESRLYATQKEIEAGRESERLANAAMQALQESESILDNINYESSISTVTLPIEEYFHLSKRSYDSEEKANKIIEAAMTRVESAKESEWRSSNKLEELIRNMNERKEALRFLTKENNEDSNEERLYSLELRNSVANSPATSLKNFEKREEVNISDNEQVPSNSTSPLSVSNSSFSEKKDQTINPEGKRKKKSLIHKISFFTTRKSQG